MPLIFHVASRCNDGSFYNHFTVFASTHYFVLPTHRAKLSQARSISGTVNKFISVLSPSDKIILTYHHYPLSFSLSDESTCFGASHTNNSICFFLNSHMFFYTGTSHKNINKCFHRNSYTPPHPSLFVLHLSEFWMLKQSLSERLMGHKNCSGFLMEHISVRLPWDEGNQIDHVYLAVWLVKVIIEKRWENSAG